MPIFSDKQRGAFLGFSLGVASVLLSRKFFPAMREAGRPITKSAIKGGMAAYAKTRQAVAQLTESVEDIVAEAIHETEEQDQRKTSERARASSARTKENKVPADVNV
jgi:hypothetical protein